MSELVVLGGVTYSLPDPGDSPNWATGLTPYLVALAANVASNPAFMQFVSVAATPTAMVSGKTYLVTTASLPITLNLPTPVQNTWMMIKDVSNNAATNTITVHRAGSEQIDGSAADKGLARSGGTWLLMSDGTNWWTINQFAHSGTDSGIVNADIAASAAIAYSKLSLTGSVVNADINVSAAIAYSKLSLTGSIVNADINASAAIAYSKLSLGSSVQNTDLVSGTFSRITGLGTQTQALAMGSNKITGLANGTVSGDAAAFGQVTGTRILQQVTATTSSPLDTTSSTYQSTNLNASITPASTASKIRITVTGDFLCNNPANTTAEITIFRGATDLGSGTPLSSVGGGAATTAIAVPVCLVWLDSPASASSVTYTVKILSTANNASFHAKFPNLALASILLEEIG